MRLESKGEEFRDFEVVGDWWKGKISSRDWLNLIDGFRDTTVESALSYPPCTLLLVN